MHLLSCRCKKFQAIFKIAYRITCISSRREKSRKSQSFKFLLLQIYHSVETSNFYQMMYKLKINAGFSCAIELADHSLTILTYRGSNFALKFAQVRAKFVNLDIHNIQMSRSAQVYLSHKDLGLA